jgi:hypothetical protein
MKRAPGLIYKGEEISDRAIASILGGSFLITGDVMAIYYGPGG